MHRQVGTTKVGPEEWNRILETIGCKPAHVGVPLEQSTGALLHLLEVQGWLMGNRGFSNSGPASDQAKESVALYLWNLLKASQGLREAVATTHFVNEQRQAA